MKAFLYAVFSVAVTLVMMIVWLMVLGVINNGIIFLAVTYAPWGMVAYYWWRTWKSERHERLVL